MKAFTLRRHPPSISFDHMSITAIVQKDMVVLPPGVHLPDGTRVRLEPVPSEPCTSWPRNYFEETAGVLSGERFERPAQRRSYLNWTHTSDSVLLNAPANPSPRSSAEPSSQTLRRLALNFSTTSKPAAAGSPTPTWMPWSKRRKMIQHRKIHGPDSRYASWATISP